MSAIICSTITAKTPAEFAMQSEKIALTDAMRVQIDIADGDFASPQTVNLNQIYWDEKYSADLHLMMKKPSEWIEAIVSLAPNLVILHAESEGNLSAIFEHLQKFDIKVGVAILPETQPETIQDLLEQADHALIFAGNLGHQGGNADLVQLEKVAQIRAMNPDIEIGWDGGANESNVRQIVNAGVDVVNVGAAIQNSVDPRETYQKLSELAKI